MKKPITVALISTYELGRQPFGLASPAAWLREAGVTVHCLDLAVEGLDEELVAAADVVAFYVPMHTATRLAAGFLPRVRAINPAAHVCFYGLYAPVNEGYLREIGADSILGGEFEAGLVSLAARLSRNGSDPDKNQAEPTVSLQRQRFLIPDRGGLPDARRYAYVKLPDGGVRTAGATEASRGCKHRCRHCPIVPVYGGRFFVVQAEVVLEDVARQVATGVEHITFGDPDFFNGPAHAMRIVNELHERFPGVTYDVTIKIEHLLRHAAHLPTLRETGCLFVTSAVEAVDDGILEIFAKRHTRADFVRAVALCREAGLTMNPTFVAFNPWITLAGYRALLHTIDELDLVANVSPIQYAIRLLIPAGSRLLGLPFVRELVDEFDPAALAYPWRHPDPRVDRLQAAILDLVGTDQGGQDDRFALFARVLAMTEDALALPSGERTAPATASSRRNEPIPHLSEPWYC